jgi:Uma2 family endonuclease
MVVDEFLERSFDHECELIHGETVPKPFGTIKHSRMEKRLTRLLERYFGENRVQFELSVRMGDEVLIPDICVAKTEDPRMYRDVLDEPPLLCIEVPSPSQRVEEMLAKCRRYRDFNVPHYWVVDPVSERAWEFHASQGGPREVRDAFSEPCGLSLAEIFPA